jgi:hypothetical protein
MDYGAGWRTSSDVHQTSPEKCERFCHECRDDPSWLCYHHPFFCNAEYREQYYQEVEELKQRFNTNLEDLAMKSKIRCHANPTKSVKTLCKTSIDFIPSNSDEMDGFIDLSINELL